MVEVFGRDSKQVLWEVQDDRVVEVSTNHDEIGLQGFDYDFFLQIIEAGRYRRVQ